MSSNMFDGLEAALVQSERSENDQPVILSHQIVDASKIAGVSVVCIGDWGSKEGEDKVADLIALGYEVMTVSITRHDGINFGSAGVSSVEHRISVVLVKLKQQ